VKGIAVTILRLLYVSRRQRWLVGVGLLVTLCALGALARGAHEIARPLFVLAGVLGIVVTVIAPVVAGPLLFRSLSAPRTIALIPHGRLKLALGAFGAQLLLALFTGAGMGLLHSYDGFHPGGAFADAGALAGAFCALAFGALTLYFMIFSWAMRWPLGPFIWLPLLFVPRMAAMIFPGLTLGPWLRTPQGLGVVIAVSLLAWLLFTLRYVRSREIRPAGVEYGRTGCPAAALRRAQRLNPARASRLQPAPGDPGAVDGQCEYPAHDAPGHSLPGRLVHHHDRDHHGCPSSRPARRDVGLHYLHVRRIIPRYPRGPDGTARPAAMAHRRHGARRTVHGH